MYGLNGWLSSIYLHQVFEQPGDVWAQLPGRFMVRGAGIGALGGALLGALLLFYAGIRSTLSCPAPLIVALVPKMASVVWMGWVVMGVNSVILFWCAPDLRVFDYARIVRDHAPVTSRVFQTCGYLWDLGSPFGALLGTFFALAMGCSAFDRAWRKHQKRNAS